MPACPPGDRAIASPSAAFEVIAPSAAARPLVLHIPHAGTMIPAEVRSGLLPSDSDLDREKVRLTDWHTDRLFAWGRGLGATMMVNRLSRLVVDPERFADDAREPMAAVGQGAVYAFGTDGRRLRRLDDADREALIRRWYDPYHAELTTIVGSMLNRFGTCLILDCHSFATVPLASEPDQSPGRPDVCIGTDAYHTPPALVAGLVSGAAAEGFKVDVDHPFSGALVPAAWYGREQRVTSVLIEVRRGLYCDERTGSPIRQFNDVARRLERAVRAALALGR